VKKKKMKNTKKGIIALFSILAVCLLATPAMADYDYDGFDLDTVLNDTACCGKAAAVYVNAGDHYGAYEYGTQHPDWYVTNYTSVPAETVEHARLYVGVWAGTETKRGWVNTTLNGHILGNDTIGGELDPNPTYDIINTSVYGSGHGVWWVAYNCTDEVTMGGLNTANATTEAITAGFDGRVNGIVLVVIHEASDEAGCRKQYWVNEGNPNLNYVTNYDNTIAWFNGEVQSYQDELCVNATLSVVYLASSYQEPDMLYFNAPGDPDDWHRPHQLGDDLWPWCNCSSCYIAPWTYMQPYNITDTWGDDDVADGMNNMTPPAYFDIKHFDVCNLVEAADNYASFWCGHDYDGDGSITAGFQAHCEEGEGYLHPVLAVLELDTCCRCIEIDMVGGVDNHFALPIVDSVNIIEALDHTIPFSPWVVYRYNSIMTRWESVDTSVPEPFWDFNTLDPGRGYAMMPDYDFELDWPDDYDD
jgi:hypothetical protein